MPFPSPAAGHEESPIGDTIMETLVPRPSATICWPVQETFEQADLQIGDVITIELDRRPHHGCIALIDHQGETLLCKLYWRNGKWYALSNDRKGVVTEDMELRGVGHWVIRNQINEHLS